MSSDRDTHFANAAKLLAEALYIALADYPIDFTGSVGDEFDELVLPLIAQFAYDVSCHVLTSKALHDEFLACVDGDSTLDSPLELLRDIADLTAWPPVPVDAPVPTVDQPPVTSPRTD